MGNVAQGVAQLRTALQLIEKALPSIPMGTPLHEQAMKVASTLAKHLSDHAEQSGAERQTLVQALRGLQNNQQMQALGRMVPQQPNQPPAMMPPGGGAMAA
jgi:hypothetical protein